MTRWLTALILPGLFLSHFAVASTEAVTPHPEDSSDCELDLSAEFSREPENTSLGFITRNVAITPKAIIEAYSRGIFPWSVTTDGMGEWFSPPERGVLDLTTLDIPRGDRKAIRKIKESGRYVIKVDTAFREVITECAHQQRLVQRMRNGVLVPEFDKRWITDEHIEMFSRLHDLGLAHSVEVWEGDVLVGGLYGVFVNGYFSGESMFYNVPDVTKWAYEYLLTRLKENGHKRIDVQQISKEENVTNVGLSKKWGGYNIPRGTLNRPELTEGPTFYKWLEEAKRENNPF